MTQLILENGKVTVSQSFEAPRKLSKRQEYMVKRMASSGNYQDISRFFDSMKGTRHSMLSCYTFNLESRGNSDRLANKSSGAILELFAKQFDINEQHSPKAYDLGTWLGIEIECFLPSGISKNDIQKQIKARKIKLVTLKTDGSLKWADEDDGDEGEMDHNMRAWEFNVISNVNDMANLEKLCALLDDLGAAVNKTCGLHVHLDFRDVKGVSSRAKRVKRLVNMLPLLAAMLPKSRRANSFCQYGASEGRSGRYFMVNDRDAYRRHKTVEIRMHSGTIDYTKISNWCRLLYSISRAQGLTEIDLGASRRKIINDRAELMEALGMLMDNTSLPDSFHDYILERCEKFSKDVREFKKALTEAEKAALAAQGTPCQVYNPDTGSYDVTTLESYFGVVQSSTEHLRVEQVTADTTSPF